MDLDTLTAAIDTAVREGARRIAILRLLGELDGRGVLVTLGYPTIHIELSADVPVGEVRYDHTSTE